MCIRNDLKAVLVYTVSREAVVGTATRTAQCSPLLRDQTLNSVIVILVVIIPDNSVEKPVVMILKDKNEGNLDKWLFMSFQLSYRCLFGVCKNFIVKGAAFY